MKLYIDVETLQKQTLLSARECRKVIQLVRSELAEKGCYIPKSKKLMAPTDLVLKKLNIER